MRSKLQYGSFEEWPADQQVAALRALRLAARQEVEFYEKHDVPFGEASMETLKWTEEVLQSLDPDKL
ncbi:MAG: hypothetical protein AAF530_14165 [Pseudomonadota bacterium]